MYCADASLNAEGVHKCTDVNEPTAQLDGVHVGLFQSVPYYCLNHLPGVCMCVRCATKEVPLKFFCYFLSNFVCLLPVYNHGTVPKGISLSVTVTKLSGFFMQRHSHFSLS